MNRRGLKCGAIATGLVLIVLLLHHAWVWERNRFCLETPKGTIRLGMTLAEVEAVLGPDGRRPQVFASTAAWQLDGCFVLMGDDVSWAIVWDSTTKEVVRFPRPPFVEHVLSWFTGKREE